MTSLHIRRYEPSDYKVVWDLHNIALAATGSHLGNGQWDDDLHNIEEEYLNKKGEFLVGLVENQIVAMGALQHKSDEVAIIRRMRVNPNYQRQGFGQQLLDRLENIARQRGYKVLELDTTVLQEAARRLYERNGYAEVRREMVKFETVFYEKILS